MTSSIRLAVCVAVLLLCGGCGGGGETAEQVELHPVAGTIKVDGKPAAGVTIGLRPDTGTPGKGGYAVSNPDGTFNVTYNDGREGVPAGKYYVLLTWLTLPDGSPMPKDAMAADVGAENRLPERYSVMEDNPNFAMVQAGSNPSLDISVASKKGK